MWGKKDGGRCMSFCAGRGRNFPDGGVLRGEGKKQLRERFWRMDFNKKEGSYVCCEEPQEALLVGNVTGDSWTTGLWRKRTKRPEVGTGIPRGQIHLMNQNST